MLSLTLHGILGLVVIALIVRANPEAFRRTASPLLSGVELLLVVVAVASVGVGWYFNVTFVTENTDGWLSNPLWGDGSWAQYMQLIFDNPASGSAAGDFSIANVAVLPIALYLGRGQGIRRIWLFFVATLFLSFSFGWAAYLFTLERQRRLAAERVERSAAA